MYVCTDSSGTCTKICLSPCYVYYTYMSSKIYMCTRVPGTFVSRGATWYMCTYIHTACTHTVCTYVVHVLDLYLYTLSRFIRPFFHQHQPIHIHGHLYQTVSCLSLSIRSIWHFQFSCHSTGSHWLIQCQ